MKQAIIITFFCALGLIAGGWWIKATFFEAGSFLVTESTNVNNAYRLNVKGEDLRVYEITPKGAPNSLCIIFAGTNKGDMECVTKSGTVTDE